MIVDTLKSVVQFVQTRATYPWLTGLWRSALLDRWLIKEITSPLLFAIAAFTVVSLSVGVMFELIRRIVESGLPVITAIQILGLRLPGFLVISFPMATLMACLLAYSRLSANSELTALRSVGITTRRIVAPALALSIFMTLVTFIFNDIIVPRANQSAELTFRRALGRSLATEKGNDIIYSQFGQLTDTKSNKQRRGLARLFYARKFDNGTMQNVTVLDFSRLGFTQMLVAERGDWNEQEAKWEFLDGQILTLTPNGSTTRADFEHYFYPLNAGPLQVAQLPKDANNMTLSEAIEAERLLTNAGSYKQARKLRVRIQEKFTLPIACLVFGLVGSSLGARPNSRTGRSQGFGISILIILAYYMISFSFSSLGVKGAITPITAAWSPVLISLGTGSWLLHQSSR
ncbi:YjgP/YjgQ family permease [cyanobiont of Ornithocercus magnificus]|nr:YjgP/YjgQ family permease [cyanobiont of Ornithocercus magnificus]